VLLTIFKSFNQNRHFDINLGTEELAHSEIISAIVYQLTKGLSIEEIKKSGFDTYFVDHTTALYPVAASGTPFTATYFQSKGDAITDLIEDLAADGTIIQEQHFIFKSSSVLRWELALLPYHFYLPPRSLSAFRPSHGRVSQPYYTALRFAFLF
jgi:hypothetical protein